MTSFSLDRDVVICAPRELVFRYFTDSERWAKWWGAGSRIDARVGGEVLVVYPGGATARGEVVELVANERIVFTYGYDKPAASIAPGGSRVTITLADAPGGTLVTLRHDVATEAIRDEHRAGWRYQMAVFGDVVSREAQGDIAERVDRWLVLWSQRDATARRTEIATLCAPDVVYRDRFGYARGHDDLDGHIAAAQVHLPTRLVRDGALLASLGVAVVPWRAEKDDGAVLARGTSVIEMSPDARIARVTGLWG